MNNPYSFAEFALTESATDLIQPYIPESFTGDWNAVSQCNRIWVGQLLEEIYQKRYPSEQPNQNSHIELPVVITTALESLQKEILIFPYARVWFYMDKYINIHGHLPELYDMTTGKALTTCKAKSNESHTIHYLAVAYVWLIVFRKSRRYRYLSNVFKILDTFEKMDMINNNLLLPILKEILFTLTSLLSRREF